LSLKYFIPFLAGAFCVTPLWASPAGDTLAELLAIEHRIMDAWREGNPDPLLAAADAEITYYHIVTEQRLEGLPALKELVERYRGMPLFDSYEIRNAKAQTSGDVAVLTYQLAQTRGSVTAVWNGTLVYRKKTEGWRVIHTHWSEAKARQR
jgi:hypothetical protein